MDRLKLFTDGSVNTQTKVGYGAYLVVHDKDLPLQALKPFVKLKRFDGTSSTKLELETLLWALSEIRDLGSQLILYTDSQNITGLERRRRRLEQNDFRSKNQVRIHNFKLYQEFYHLTDVLDMEIVKVSGHLKSHDKDWADRVFTLVDRASRNAVRRNAQ